MLSYVAVRHYRECTAEAPGPDENLEYLIPLLHVHVLKSVIILSGIP